MTAPARDRTRARGRSRSRPRNGKDEIVLIRWPIHIPFSYDVRRSIRSKAIELMTTPLFSVIIPLEYHRGQWQRCWRAWHAQTLPRSQFETIMVVPPDFPEQEKLPAQLGPQDRLEYST